MRPRPADAVFDLDGTLSNPIEGLSRSLNHALRSQGFKPVPRSRVAQLIGPPLDQMFHVLTGTLDDGEMKALVQTYRERYSAIGLRENVIYPGVKEALEVLRKAGLSMGVCTSKRADYATRILEVLEIRHFFDFVDGGDIGVEKWQQLAGLRDQGVVDKRSVMIGDRGVDMRAAHRNGLSAGGVLWGFGSRGELRAENPAHLFEAPAEWAELISADRDRTGKREGTGG